MALCSECGTANTEGMKFCGECGSPLGERRPAREERRVVTVLFADVVGFTSRSESLDVEDVGAFLAPFHRIATEQVEQFGGVIAKFIGDGVMALFGAPVAHEDDSERAVRAAPRSSSSWKTCVSNGRGWRCTCVSASPPGRCCCGSTTTVASTVSAMLSTPPPGWSRRLRSTACWSARAPAVPLSAASSTTRSRRCRPRASRVRWRRPSPAAPGGTPATLRPPRSWVAARSASSCGPNSPASAMHDGPPRSCGGAARRGQEPAGARASPACRAEAASGLVAEGALGSLPRRGRAVATGRDPQAALGRARRRPARSSARP